MIVDFEQLNPSQIYFAMIQTILPRPVAWVLSRSQQGSINLAPFSYFNAVCSAPPLIMLSIGYKRDGERKDSWKNIEATKSFVINIPSTEDAQMVSDSAFEFDYEESELSALDITTDPVFEKTDLEKVSSAKVAFHCEWYETKLLGPKEQGLVFAEIKELFVADQISEMQRNRLVVDADQFAPLSRLGGSDFAEFGKSFTIQRAKSKPGQ